MVKEFGGLFGKVMADLIAEGQSDPTMLRDLYEHHISHRRAATVAVVERGIATGEFSRVTDAERLVDALSGAVFLRLLLHLGPFNDQYADQLLDQLLRGTRPTPG